MNFLLEVLLKEYFIAHFLSRRGWGLLHSISIPLHGSPSQNHPFIVLASWHHPLPQHPLFMEPSPSWHPPFHDSDPFTAPPFTIPHSQHPLDSTPSGQYPRPICGQNDCHTPVKTLPTVAGGNQSEMSALPAGCKLLVSSSSLK